MNLNLDRSPAKAGVQSDMAPTVLDRPGPRLSPGCDDEVRRNWTREEIAALFDLPFDELMWEAQGVHRRHHARGEIQLCTLLSIKTGGCVEDCGYC